MVSTLTLCRFPASWRPFEVSARLVKPDGQFIFFELAISSEPIVTVAGAY